MSLPDNDDKSRILPRSPDHRVENKSPFPENGDFVLFRFLSGMFSSLIDSFYLGRAALDVVSGAVFLLQLVLITHSVDSVLKILNIIDK